MQLIELFQEVTDMKECVVKETDIKFFLSTRKNMESPEPLSKQIDVKMDMRKPTKFIIHGWIENYKVGWYKAIKDEYLKYEDVNVIYVDWESVAKSPYISSAKNTVLVGNVIGKFIIENKIPLEQVHLIGHSLGSHVAGFASKYIKRATGYKMKRISALDPAGPYFRLPEVKEHDRLNAQDAEIVDVLHTDGKFLGYFAPIGTLDIYVNGGSRRQPGCHDGELRLDIHETLKSSLCSHARSYAYYIESINNAAIVCKKCQSFKSFLDHDCSATDAYMIEHENVTEDMKGICTVSTDSHPPYFAY